MKYDYAVVGDVHGCLDELKELMEKVNENEVQELVFLGDLVDKGPFSEETVTYVRELASQRKVTLLMGNHEWKHLQQYDKGKKTEVTLSPENVEYLRLAEFYYFFDSDSHRNFAVHGGLFPAYFKNYPCLPSSDQVLKCSNSLKGRLLRFLSVRYCNSEGQMVPLGEEKPEDYFWAEWYKGEYGHAFFGHQHWFDGLKKFPFATGVDTACVFGGQLTAVLVQGNKHDVVSVQAKKQYATPRK